jgi:F0F1-type ATP synthase assembly protein I
MPPEDKSEKKRKYPLLTFGFGHLPPAFDLALRWGLTLAIVVLLGFFIGRWIDTKLNTTPLFLLIGVFWGVGGSFYYLFLQIKQQQEKQDSEKDEASSS